MSSKYAALKQECYEANMELNALKLVVYTFGNVSAVDRENGVFAIKPSGVAYEDLKPEDIPEKNRLLFVACTRAKEELYISGVTIAVSTAAEDVENLFLNECLQVAGEMYVDEKEEFAS